MDWYGGYDGGEGGLIKGDSSLEVGEDIWCKDVRRWDGDGVEEWLEACARVRWFHRLSRKEDHLLLDAPRRSPYLYTSCSYAGALYWLAKEGM